MRLSIQNQSEFAKSFAEAGTLPLYMGPQSSADITPEQFVIFEKSIRDFTTSPRPVDGMLRLLFTDENGATSQVDVTTISKAVRDGHFGEPAQKLALAADKFAQSEAERYERMNHAPGWQPAASAAE